MLMFNETGRGISIKENTIQLSNKNQIYLDSDNAWVLEQFEYVEGDDDMFSVFDSFEDLETAIKYGFRLNDRTRDRLYDELISMREAVAV
jgi:hypothetical protein